MSDKQRRRVVITGFGAVSPCGLSAEETWDAIRNGRSGVSKVEAVTMPEDCVDIGGEIKHFDPARFMDKRTIRKTDRFAQIAVNAAGEAIEHSGIDIQADGDRVGCSVGTGIGGLMTQEIAHEKLFSAGADRLNPFWVTALIANMGAAEVSMRFGTRGPLTTESTACAASAMSIGNATMYIRQGMCDAMLAGGVEAPIRPLALGGFGNMRALSRRWTTPRAPVARSIRDATALCCPRAAPC